MVNWLISNQHSPVRFGHPVLIDRDYCLFYAEVFIATLKVIRTPAEPNTRRANIKIVIAETGEMLRGVQKITYEESVDSNGKLIVEILQPELDLKFDDSEIEVVHVSQK